MSRIDEITVRAFTLPFREPYRNAYSDGTISHYVQVVARSEDMVGVGEVSPMPGYSAETSASVLAAVRDHLAPCLIGMEVAERSQHHALADAVIPGNEFAKAALDLALWDLQSRALGVAPSVLAGGSGSSMTKIGVVVPLASPEAMAAKARSWAGRGAGYFQLKTASSLDDTRARVRAVREAVGEQARIAVDGNGSFNRLEALRTADALAKLGVEAFEQPLPRHDLAGMGLLVRQAAVVIVADESLHTARDALRICDAGAATGFNVKLSKSGISESCRILAIARAAGIRCGLGTMFESNRGTHMALQFAAALHDPLFPCELIGPWMVDDPDDHELLNFLPDEFAWAPTQGGSASSRMPGVPTRQ